jgi:hypothetical protein
VQIVGVESSRANRGCFKCGDKGHFARNCPQNEALVSMSVTSEPRAERADATQLRLSQNSDQSPVARMQESRHIVGSRTADLPAVINGGCRSCVLDTGSGISVIPESFVRDYVDIRPSEQKLYAANGTEIEILGETTVDLLLDGLTLKANCMVSECVGEMLLRLDWMEANGMDWDFKTRIVRLSGKQFVLHSQSTEKISFIHRVVLQEDTLIPARSCKNVKARTVYATLKPSMCHWATESKEVIPGVLMARTVVKDQPSDVVVQVMKASERVVEMNRGAPLGRLEPVELLYETNGKESSTKDQPAFIEDFVSEIDPSISEKSKERLKTLLITLSDVFSQNELDLGHTTVVQHSIDTGRSKPVRQALRRQPLAMIEAIDDQLKLMQEQGIIEPCQSQWASNIVMVRKKDGSLRCCVD